MGQPATKGISDENLWIYIERTLTRGKLLKLGRNYLKENNVLVLEFDDFGILKKKEFFRKENMNKIRNQLAISNIAFYDLYDDNVLTLLR